MNHYERARSLVPLSSDQGVLQLSMSLRDKSRAEQRHFFGGSQKAGWFYLYANDAVQPSNVLECVMSAAGDQISSLYKGHPILESIGELIRTREGLIDELAQKIGLSWDSVGIEDRARGRMVGLNELGTAQLIDMLEEQNLRGSAKQRTDTHGLDAPVEGAAETATPKGREVKASLDEAHVLVQTEQGIKPVPLADLDGAP